MLLFFYTVLLTLLLPVFFPHLRLMFFAPYLVIAYTYKTKISCLWLSILCGLAIDVLSAQTRFGVIALNYCLTTWILYPSKDYLFKDSLSTIPLMTFLFAFLSTWVHVILLYLLGQEITISWSWIKTDLISMPLQDAFYAALAFTIPLLFASRQAFKRKTRARWT